MSDLPDEWEPPEELLAPTSDTGSNLAIRMLSDEALQHDCVALLGQWITERSRLTTWFLVDRGGSRGNLRLQAELALVDSTQQRAVYTAWQARSGLAEALRTAIDALVAARGQTG